MGNQHCVFCNAGVAWNQAGELSSRSAHSASHLRRMPPGQDSGFATDWMGIERFNAELG
jgi:hypothetical protein